LFKYNFKTGCFETGGGILFSLILTVFVTSGMIVGNFFVNFQFSFGDFSSISFSKKILIFLR